MKNEYNFQKFVYWCNDRGIGTNLPNFFTLLFDETFYSVTDLRLLTSISNETFRRWFRTGVLKNQSASNAYKAYGKDVKQVLFNRPKIVGPLMENKLYQPFFEKQLG